jgi:hypothetical protein
MRLFYDLVRCRGKEKRLFYVLIAATVVVLWPWAVLDVFASLVEVTRWDAVRHQWVFVGGDLVTPDPSPGDQGLSTVDNILIWDGKSVGPLFADVQFLDSSLTPIDTLNHQKGSVTPMLEFPETLEGSLANSLGSTSGTVQPVLSLSGNIDGTVNATASITLEGTITPTSPVPLPDTAWMFGSGLAGFVGLLLRKRLS